MKTRLATALAVGAAALALGACGDDEDETTPAEEGGATTALTKEAYIREANETCARINEDLAQIENFPQDGPPVIEQGLSELRSLPAPEGDEEQVDEMLSAGEQGLEELREQVDAGEQGGQDTFDEFTRLAQQYGIEGGCTGAGGGPGG